MSKKSSVSEDACLHVLRAISNERIESMYMNYKVIRDRSGYSMRYTRAVINELRKRGWITVEPGNRLSNKKIRLTKEGGKQLGFPQ